jgi:hypothetical protein
MTTARDLIFDAMLKIGVIGQSDVVNNDEATAALRELNRMVQTWQNDSLMIYTVDRQVFPFVINQQFYTIGVGGDFVTTYPVRPGQIDMASVIISGGTVENPIEILNDEQWRDVTVKQTDSTFPLAMWANGNYPLNTLAFWPVPQSSVSLVLYIWGQTNEFSSINTTVTLPKGYEDAIVNNLALRLCPSYGVVPNPIVHQDAKESKSWIKKMNWEPTYRSADSALLGTQNNIGQRSRGYVID